MSSYGNSPASESVVQQINDDIPRQPNVRVSVIYDDDIVTYHIDSYELEGVGTQDLDDVDIFDSINFTAGFDEIHDWLAGTIVDGIDIPVMYNGVIVQDGEGERAFKDKAHVNNSEVERYDLEVV